MAMLEVKNRAYQDKIEKALFEAVVQASKDEATNTAAMLSGEIVQACINLIALMAGTSEATRSPTRTREFADDCAKVIRMRCAEVRRKHEAGDLSFMTVVNPRDRH